MSEAALTRARLLGAFATVGGASALLAACGGSEDDDASQTEGGIVDAAQRPGRAVAPFDEAVAENFGTGDLGIANYALTLEYLEAAFYDEMIASGVLDGAAELELITEIGENEKEHVKALEAMISGAGGELAPMPRTRFEFPNKDAALTLAYEVEEVGAAAYLSQASRIVDKEILAAALSIHTVEGAHAAALATVLGRSILPDGSISAPDNATIVLESIQPFLVEAPAPEKPMQEPAPEGEQQ